MPQKISKFIYNKKVYIIISIALLISLVAIVTVIYNITKPKNNENQNITQTK